MCLSPVGGPNVVILLLLNPSLSNSFCRWCINGPRYKKRTNLGAFKVHKNRDFPNEFRGKFQTFLFLDCGE